MGSAMNRFLASIAFSLALLTSFTIPIQSAETNKTFVSAGPAQKALSIPTTGVGVKLTVPTASNGNVLAQCAYITVFGNPIYRTSDGTTPGATDTQLPVGPPGWADCGPLTAYKFLCSTGTCTMTIEYFK